MVPQFLMEKVPAMLGCDAVMFSPSSVSLEENNTHSDMKKNNRRSLGGKKLMLDQKRMFVGSEVKHMSMITILKHTVMETLS